MSVPTPPFRTGDTVFHTPTGETWVCAYADPVTGGFGWCGWPEGEADIADCSLVQAATDAEHGEMLDRVIASGGTRASKAISLYRAPTMGEAA